MEKYSEKFIRDYSKLNSSVIGIEAEFFSKEISYYKTLELLNQEMFPIQIYGFRQYHPDFKPTGNQAIITPDLSGGSSMVEWVSSPMPYQNAKYYLIKILKFIQKIGYTNDKCSIHFNVSFSGDKNLNDLNILKLILNTDEDEIYRFFPGRKGNIYAKSVKKIIPYKEYDFFNIPIDSVKNMIRLPDDKYFGINFLNINNDKKTQRLEYRYIGGAGYEKNIGTILYFLDKYIINVYDSIGSQFNKSDADILEHYLEENINKFKLFSKYDNFIVEFPKIQIQVDQNNMYELINSYFGKIFERIWNLIESTDSLTNCIINYVSSTHELEVVDAKIKSNLNMNDLDFINCIVLDGIYTDCTFYGCEVTNSQITKSKIQNSEISNSKVLSCHVEGSGIKDCYFMNGFLNGDMFGGVFRSGKLGPYGSISPETKIVNDTDNFFNVKFGTETEKSYKGSIKAFKK